MIEAPVLAAPERFVSRSSRQRKDGSSWKPTGMRGEPMATAGTTAASTNRQPRMRRARFIWSGLDWASRPTLPRMSGRSGGTNTRLTAFLLVGLRTSEALDLAPPSLRREALLDRPAVRPRRAPRPPYAQRFPERRDEPLERQFPVPQLAALVLGDGLDRRADPVDDPLLLRVRQRRRRLHVEQRLDPRLRLLRVLPARPARPGRAEADLGAPDRDAARDLDPVGTRLARDGVNSGDEGCRLVRVGVDLIEISRVRRTLQRYSDFRARCFTEAERAYCDSRPNPAQH